ncbi:MAP kinase-activating death domain protein isoform X2 [Adelges cooleyi]|uniref:MAP kinase-activating death domain protein isoform X2 n=1 Tax=Adelges cooleyi TaxID=133065 RepID=UPI00217F7140|nr:MAP kinase-activating death domain protein isoform X2 [Adelges cooleyi]
MSESRYFCPRLIDYITIVGAKPQSLKRANLYELQTNPTDNDQDYLDSAFSASGSYYVQDPELLRRYPADEHKDFALPETMAYFCQPEGCLSFSGGRSESNKVTSFVFTLTDKDTTRIRYGVCVNFYRRIDPYVRSTSETLEASDGQYTYKRPKDYSSLFLKCHSTSSSFSQSFSREDSIADQGTTAETQAELFSLTSLCLVSHHPLFSSFRECLFYLKNIIDSCNKKLGNHRRKGRKKNNCIWSILTGLVTRDYSPRVFRYIKEIETWILRLLSVPVPVPGKTRLEIYLFSQNERRPPLIFSLPDHTRFSLIDFPLHLPLELLGIDTCLYVLTIIMLENKVVFQSKDYNALSMSVMALITLMYPLQYMFTVIPLLPTSLPKSEMLFESPVPYVVGVPCSFFQTKRDFRFPKDVWIVDLDSTKITPPAIPNRDDGPIPQLPKSEAIVLKNNLKNALSGLFRSNINTKPPNYFLDNGVMASSQSIGGVTEECTSKQQQSTADNYNNPPINPDEAVSDVNTNWDRRKSSSSSVSATSQNTRNRNSIYSNGDIDSVDVAIRVAMVQFFLSGDVLANLTEHSRTLRLYPRPVVFFQINSFLNSRPTLSQFTCQLARTQAVDYFAEWALTPSNVVFQRIQTGVDDPAMIGDKSKWYSSTLDSIVYNVWQLGWSIQKVMDNTTASAQTSGDLYVDTDSSSSGDEQPSRGYRDDNVYQTPFIEQEERDIGPVTEDINMIYEPPVSLQLSTGPDDDDDGAVESTGSKSIGSSPSSSHSDMSSPMFKPEPIMLPAPVAGNRLVINRHGTGGSDSALNHLVTVQKPYSYYRPAMQTAAISTSFQVPAVPAGEKRPSVTSSPPLGRKESICNLPSQLSRQSSQNSSILEQFAFQAKELVRETARQSSQDGSGGIFAHVADKLTTQAKKAAGEATKSVHEVSKSALEASKTAAGVSKNTFDDLTYVGKSTIDDLTKSAKQVASKKGFKVGLLGESSSLSRSLEDDVNDPPAYPTMSSGFKSTSDIGRTPSTTSMEASGGKDFFSNITSDINGLATQTSSMFSDLFGNKQQKSNKTSLTLPVTKSKDRTPFGPFPSRGRNGLVEKSNLIKHSNPKKPEDPPKAQSKRNVKLNSHTDNETFLKDVTKQILDGDGIGWLKLNRFKKLMEEEGYRNLVLSKLNRTLDYKISPSDHIDDVYISRPVWKGMLKALLAIVHGLEVSFANQSGGGLASAFQVLEIAHTHYWTKDLSMVGFESQASSPYGSHENIRSPPLSPSAVGSPVSSANQESRKSSQTSTSGLFDCKSGGRLVHESSIISESRGSITPTVSTSEMFDEFINKKQENVSGNSPTMDNEGDTTTVISSATSDISSCSGSTGLVNNPAFYLKRVSPNNNNRNSATLFRSAVSDSELDNSGLFKASNKNRTQSIWSSKSSLSAGFRYPGGNFLNPTSGSPSPESGRTYLFEGILGKERSTIWNQLKFWEDVFIDTVSQERDMIGMDQGPIEMMERYKNLSQSEKKRLEYDEDKLLSVMIHNLIAFMIMMNVPKDSLMKIVRTLVGKSRVTNCYATEITGLMSQLTNLHGNDVDLKPSNSRQAHRQSFAVHCGDSSGELLFLEVRDDGLVLRSGSGIIISRWWYERIVNMTYSPRSKIFCLWRTANGGQLQLNKYYTKKCKELYTRIKTSMEKAAERGQGIISGVELGGEFPVKDMATGEGGILQVCMEGVGLLFSDSKFFVRLDHVRKCFTVQKKIFVLEEYNPKLKHIIQRQYESPMAGQICYAVLCVFSYIAAGHKRPSTGNTSSTGKAAAITQQLPVSADSGGGKI